MFLAASAVIALPTVLLAFLFGQSRIFFTMARDGLLPRGLATVSRRGAPVRITLVTAAIVAVLAGLLPLGEIAALANAGTLAAFVAVCACMLIMRRRAPGRAAHLPRSRGVVRWRPRAFSAACTCSSACRSGPSSTSSPGTPVACFSISPTPARARLRHIDTRLTHRCDTAPA